MRDVSREVIVGGSIPRVLVVIAAPLVGGLVLTAGVATPSWAVSVSDVAAAAWFVGYFHCSTRQGMLDRAGTADWSHYPATF